MAFQHTQNTIRKMNQNTHNRMKDIKMDEPEELLLETPWCFYVHFIAAPNTYGSSYLLIGKAHTIREFWMLYNNVPDIKSLHEDIIICECRRVIAYSLFREGIAPEWEDPINAAGSEWGCRESLSIQMFTKMWLYYVLGAIGEQIDNCVGVRAINKSNRHRELHKIEVWMNVTDHAESQKTRRILSKLYTETPTFTHMLHSDKKAQTLSYEVSRKIRKPTINTNDI